MEQRAAFGLTVLRVVTAFVFLVHGSQKLFVEHFSGVARAMASLGMPAPEAAGVVVTLLEFLGGIALLFGLFTRAAAILLAIEMAVAVLAVHLRQGFFLPHGFEYPLTLLGASLALALAGPGAVALDAMIFRRGFWR